MESPRNQPTAVETDPEKIRLSRTKRKAKIERLEKSEQWLAKLIDWAEQKGTPTGLQASISLKRELMKSRKLRLNLKNKQAPDPSHSPQAPA